MADDGLDLSTFQKKPAAGGLDTSRFAPLKPQVPLPGEDASHPQYKREGPAKPETGKVNPLETAKSAAGDDIGAPSTNILTDFDNMVQLLGKGYNYASGLVAGGAARAGQEAGVLKPGSEGERFARQGTEFAETAPAEGMGRGGLGGIKPRVEGAAEAGAKPEASGRPDIALKPTEEKPSAPVNDPTRVKDDFVQMVEDTRKKGKILDPANQNRKPGQPDITTIKSTTLTPPETGAKPSMPANANERPGGSLGAAAAPKGTAQPPLHERPMEMVTRTMQGKPGQEGAARAAQSIAPGVKGVIARGAQWLRDTFSPSGDKSGSRAAATRREALGRAERDTAQTEAALKPFRTSIAKLPEEDKNALTDYMETRSEGAVLPDHLKHLQDVADALRDEMNKRQAKLENLSTTEKMGFIEDFVHHAYANGKAVYQALRSGGGKMGSGGFTKERSIPTYAEARKMGFVPKTTDPIQNAIDYVTNADKWIALKEHVEVGKENGDIRYYHPGGEPPGWAKIERLGQNNMGQAAYAPEGYALIMNNTLSRGMQGNAAAPIYKVLRTAQNAIGVFKFALPGFHASVMAVEGLASGVGRAAGQVLHGHPVEAMKSVGRGLLSPIDPLLGKHGTAGKMRNAYTNVGETTPLHRQVSDILTRAGFRSMGMDKSFRANSGPGSIFTAWKNGTLKLEAQDLARRFGQAGPAGKAVEIAKGIGRILDTIQEPLFKHYIPAMKRAAAFDRMAQFLKEHPEAGDAEQLKFAHQIADSIDNRFGEMNQDNIMWNQTFKQAAQLAMVSYSWEIGTVREIGGGAFDILSGKLTPKAEYVMGLVITSSLLNATYQELMGQGPPKSLHDLIAPRTGGTIPADQYNKAQPERARIPGYMKDVLGVIMDPVEWGKNKQGFLMQEAETLFGGVDYRGKSVVDPNSKIPGPIQQIFKTVEDAMTPIVAGQIGNEKKGTAVGSLQRMLGVSPATSAVQSPGNYKSMKRAKALRDAIDTLNSDARMYRARGDDKKAAEAKAKADRMRGQLELEQTRHKAGSADPDVPNPTPIMSDE